MDSPAEACRTVEGHADRHRRGDHDRRAHQANPALIVDDDPAFCLTYGDGVARYRYHRKHRLPSRGGTSGDGDRDPAARPLRRASTTRATVSPAFRKSRAGTAAGSMAGFSFSRPRSATTSTAMPTVWEKEPMTDLAKDGQLSVFFHDGFWHPMDTLRDKRYLEDLWASNRAPWKKW